MPNVKLIFNHKLTGANFKNHKAWFEVIGSTDMTNTGRNREIEVDFDLMIGADGAHSAARYHMMKYARMDYQQEYIDTLWSEFKIEAKSVPPGEKNDARFSISPNHLHIWPGKDFMFIAIPSFVFFTNLSAKHCANKHPGRLLHMYSFHVFIKFHDIGSRPWPSSRILRYSFPRSHHAHPTHDFNIPVQREPAFTTHQHQMSTPSFHGFHRHCWRRSSCNGTVLWSGDECRPGGHPHSVRVLRQVPFED
jgi:hypothetical protein